MMETSRRAVLSGLAATAALAVLPEPLKVERVTEGYTIDEVKRFGVLTVSIPECHVVTHMPCLGGADFIYQRWHGPALTMFTFDNRLALLARDEGFTSRGTPVLANDFFDLDKFLRPNAELYGPNDSQDGWFLYDPTENRVSAVGPVKAPTRNGRNVFSIKLENGFPVSVCSLTRFRQTTILHRLRYHKGQRFFNHWSAEFNNDDYHVSASSIWVQRSSGCV